MSESASESLFQQRKKLTFFTRFPTLTDGYQPQILSRLCSTFRPASLSRLSHSVAPTDAAGGMVQADTFLPPLTGRPAMVRLSKVKAAYGPVTRVFGALLRGLNRPRASSPNVLSVFAHYVFLLSSTLFLLQAVHGRGPLEAKKEDDLWRSSSRHYVEV